MKAVWSFWSKPFQHHHHQVWLSERHHLLAWVVSVATARRHFTHLALVTDDAGAELLVDRLGLPFDAVSTELSALDAADPNWWVLGKLLAYRAQTEPFVHLDSDVFLWQPLPDRLLEAAVFAQNPETFPFDEENWYRPLRLQRAIADVHGWAPDEWLWYTWCRGNAAASCGILGGTATDFIAHYADRAVTLVCHPSNQPAWEQLGNPVGDNILVEQYFLMACVEFHRGRTGSPFRAADLQYLFPSTRHAFDEAAARQMGYTHLIGGAKRNPTLMQRLSRRVRRDYPDYYERCLRLTSAAANPGP